MLDVRRLRVLREVAVRGTIAAAAESLHLTGPAVSQQLAALERESGTKLLEREGRSVRLTAAAQVLVAHAETILAQLEAAEADLAAGERRHGGELRIAAFPTFAVHLAPFVAELDDVLVRVHELEPEAALSALRVGDLDLAVVHEYDHVPRRADPAFTVRELLREPMLLALPAGHPATTLAELADEPGWVVPPAGLTCHEEVRRLCAEAGFEPRAASFAYSYDVTLALVAAGGVAVVPRIAALDPPPGVVVREPADVSGERRTYAAVRRGSAHRPSIERALTALARAAAPLGAERPRRRGGSAPKRRARSA